jgi:hypothetical protein
MSLASLPSSSRRGSEPLREQQPSSPVRSRARTRTRGARPTSLRQVPPAREGIRSMSRLPGRSPLPSVAFARVATRGTFEDPSTGSDTFTEVLVRATLLTLAPITDAFRSLRPGVVAPGFLSWGCPKIAPPSNVRRGVRLPGGRVRSVPAPSRPPFEMGMPVPIRVPPSWFRTTSTASSSTTPRPSCRPLPILGFTAFPSVAKRNSPRCHFCPSKLFLRRQRRGRGGISAPAVRVTGSTVSGRTVHRVPCPLALSPPACTALARR